MQTKYNHIKLLQGEEFLRSANIMLKC